jgi:hypothetical protein
VADTIGLGGGGAIYYPSVSPNNTNLMFVACDLTGLYRTANAGMTWSMQDTRLVKGSARFSAVFAPGPSTKALAFHPRRGLMESPDAGVTWAQFMPTMPLAFQATGSSTQQACTARSGAQQYDPIYPVTITTAAYCPDSPGRILIGTPRGILLFNGSSWTWVYPTPGPFADMAVPDTDLGQVVTNAADVIRFVFATDPTTGGTVYFAATVCDVLRSDTQGATWFSIAGNLPDRPLGAYQPGRPRDQLDNVGNPVAIDLDYSPSRIRGFAGGSNSSHYMLYVTIATGNDIATSGGVYFYDSTANPPNTTNVWQRAMQSPINTSPATTQSDDRNGFFIPRYEHLGVSENDPNTVYVTALNTMFHFPVVYRGTFANGNVAWSGVYDGFQEHQPGDALGVTNVNGGWLDQKAQNPPVGLGWGFGGFARGFAVDPKNSSKALFTNNGVVHLTTNGAQQWNQAYSSLATGNAGDNTGRWKSIGLEVTTTWQYAIHPDPAKANIHFICYTDIGLARSTDSGVTWQSIDQADIQTQQNGTVKGTNWRNFYELAFQHPAGPRIWAAVSNQHDIPHDTQQERAPGSGAVLTSLDGQSWSKVAGNNLPPGPVVSIVFRDGVLFAAVWGSGVFRSADQGTNWSRVGIFPSGTSPHFYRLQFDTSGNLYCCVSAKRTRSGNVVSLIAGGLYRLDAANLANPNAPWTDLTTGLRQLISPAILSPTNFAFGRSAFWSGTIYLCAASVQASQGGGGAYQMDSQGVWTKLNIPFPMDYHDTVQAFAPFVTWSTNSNGAIVPTVYVTSTSHGIWFTNQANLAPAQQTWQENKGIPFLAAQRLYFDLPNNKAYITTLGGGIWAVPRTVLTFSGG